MPWTIKRKKEGEEEEIEITFDDGWPKSLEPVLNDIPVTVAEFLATFKAKALAMLAHLDNDTWQDQVKKATQWKRMTLAQAVEVETALLEAFYPREKVMG